MKSLAPGVYLLEGFFTNDQTAAMRSHLSNQTMGDRSLLKSGYFRELIVSPPIVAIARKILGKKLLFHHANGVILPPGWPEKLWHHDYDGVSPDPARQFKMIHLMIYPEGASEHNGPLVILPSSRNTRVVRSWPGRYQTRPMAGEICPLIKPGSLLVIESQIWHCRRHGSNPDISRPYLNISFCQPGIERPERRQVLTRHAAYLTDLPLDSGLFASDGVTDERPVLQRTFTTPE
ncbi:hypothetical protein BTA51_28155 [Hahella sp. CCB-MM4]|uniref:phytanoyl-CoA dioxygenase family protein n=1 Tax=Hahella sp. (strain CCB-MM4) TaxID=1926491 RepID=UPI000B9A3764|nr:phytanoyl-CoA dioxygenase family protein [Hahella sp. CCB-MM4]OZG70004.1 hypothetical protein BTA51_28155 [Hahella sp. CCB-MM4]